MFPDRSIDNWQILQLLLMYVLYYYKGGPRGLIFFKKRIFKSARNVLNKL